jgi:hypothetical protein
MPVPRQVTSGDLPKVDSGEITPKVNPGYRKNVEFAKSLLRKFQNEKISAFWNFLFDLAWWA